MEHLEYQIEIQTGKFKGAGTASNIYLILIGTKNISSKITINHLLHTIHRGEKVTVNTKQQDLGTILVVEIIKDEIGLYPDWLLDWFRFLNILLHLG